MFSVTLYLIDKACGGREEGGWYYVCGEPQLDSSNRVFEHREDAEDYLISLQDYEEELNENLPSIDSVLSQGQYQVRIDEGFPKPFPSTKPHYE